MAADENINEKHVNGILEAIENNPVYNFKDIFVFYKHCSRSTAYEHNLDKSDAIKEALSNKKRTGVTTLMEKWIASDNATLQIAAFKQICDDDERQKLNQQNIDHTSKGDKIEPTPIIFTDGTKRKV
jgi:hypothetical protein